MIMNSNFYIGIEISSFPYLIMFVFKGLVTFHSILVSVMTLGQKVFVRAFLVTTLVTLAIGQLTTLDRRNKSNPAQHQALDGSKDRKVGSGEELIAEQTGRFTLLLNQEVKIELSPNFLFFFV